MPGGVYTSECSDCRSGNDRGNWPLRCPREQRSIGILVWLHVVTMVENEKSREREPAYAACVPVIVQCRKLFSSVIHHWRCSVLVSSDSFFLRSVANNNDVGTVFFVLHKRRRKARENSVVNSTVTNNVWDPAHIFSRTEWFRETILCSWQLAYSLPCRSSCRWFGKTLFDRISDSHERV